MNERERESTPLKCQSVYETKVPTPKGRTMYVLGKAQENSQARVATLFGPNLILIRKRRFSIKFC